MEGEAPVLRKKKWDDGAFLYQYDPENKELEKLTSLGNMFRWKDNLTTIDYMWRTRDGYDYWTTEYEDSDSASLVEFFPDGYLYTGRDNDLIKYSWTTGKETYPLADDEDADAYILLGDYLYRHYSDGWQKTNISNGWDNLQWEIFQMPD